MFNMIFLSAYEFQPLSQRIRDVAIAFVLLVLVLWIFRKHLQSKEIDAKKDKFMDSKALERLFNNDTTDNHIYWFEEPTLISYLNTDKGKILTYEVGQQEDLEVPVLALVNCEKNKIIIDKNENDIPIANYINKNKKVEIEINDRYAETIIDMAIEFYDNFKEKSKNELEK